MIKTLKPKKCRQCKELFQPIKGMQAVCSPTCAIADVRAKAEKKKDKEFRERKQALKSRNKWLEEAQEVFNKFIRLRDEDEPCMSCGREEVEWTPGGSWDCGHFLARGSHPELRFDELNAYKQCKSCNGGSGKYARKNHTVGQEYRIRLIKKFGIERVEYLEGPHEPKRYTIEQIKEIKETYKQKCKVLNDTRGHGI